MPEWWQTPYPQGRKQPVPGFPRPLHSPDNPNYAASPPGQDARAYKRILWRAGRWPGPPTNWDSEFSNQFSHGKPGGNVADSGIAGFQRQMGLDGSGQVGQKTFDLMLTSLIPAPLPNQGQPLADATALNLIGEAWQQFKGTDPAPDPPPPTPKPTHRQQALKRAITQIGIKESPTNSNRTKYTEWYGLVGPWCAMFVTWCFETEAPGSPSFQRSTRYAYVPYIVSDAQTGRYGLSLTSSPIPGDLVCYDWDRGGLPDHVGIFEKGDARTFTAIEGNTSISNNSNGGQVMRRNRTSAMAKLWFVRISE